MAAAVLIAAILAGCASSPPPSARPQARAAYPPPAAAARPSPPRPQPAAPSAAGPTFPSVQASREVTAVPLPALTPAARAAQAQAEAASQAAAAAAMRPLASASPAPVEAKPAGNAAGSFLAATGGEADEVVGDLAVYRARYEDTLLDIALANGLGFLEIMAANPGVDAWLPGEGTEVLLPKARLLPPGPRDGILLNLAEQRLFLFRKGQLVASFPIGVFRDGFSTPIGSTTVVRKTVNPTWYPPPSARADDPELPAAVPPGPDNPLGTRAMYLGWSRYLIHGTHKPYGVGRRVSRGCIRMYPADAERLYDLVPVGTRVHVVNQPVKIGWWRGELFVQAHPTIEQGIALEETGRIEPVEIPDIRGRLEAKAGDAAGPIDWPTVERALKERRGVPVQVTNVNIAVAADPRSSRPATAAGARGLTEVRAVTSHPPAVPLVR